jgi:hypothetical protein
MTRKLFSAIAASLLLALLQIAHAYTPTDQYQRLEVSGFTVLINPAVLQHPDDAEQALIELRQQIANIQRIVPDAPVAKLKTVRIWLEWDALKNGGAEFHPSAEWLSANGYNPEKAGNIEISNTRNFVNWSRADQPWMLMHELAHAYHFTVLGEDYPAILSAFDNVQRNNLYESVDYIHGGKRKAYALTNFKEYFAETTEAYFGKNDFFPFTRDQLQSYDPAGYQLMEKVWGKPKA